MIGYYKALDDGTHLEPDLSRISRNNNAACCSHCTACIKKYLLLAEHVSCQLTPVCVMTLSAVRCGRATVIGSCKLDAVHKRGNSAQVPRVVMADHIHCHMQPYSTLHTIQPDLQQKQCICVTIPSVFAIVMFLNLVMPLTLVFVIHAQPYCTSQTTRAAIEHQTH